MINTVCTICNAAGANQDIDPAADANAANRFYEAAALATARAAITVFFELRVQEIVPSQAIVGRINKNGWILWRPHCLAVAAQTDRAEPVAAVANMWNNWQPANLSEFTKIALGAAVASFSCVHTTRHHWLSDAAENSVHLKTMKAALDQFERARVSND